MTSFNNIDENPDAGLASFYLVLCIRSTWLTNLGLCCIRRSLENVAGMELAIAAGVQIFDPKPTIWSQPNI